MKYRIEVDCHCPRHKIIGWFVQFNRHENGVTTVRIEEDPHLATPMDLSFATIALRRIQEPTYGLRSRIVDQYGNAHTSFDNQSEQSGAPMSLHNSHVETTYRNHGVEVPLTFNRCLNKYYLKFSTNPDPNAPGFDQSIAGDTPEEVLERFLSNHHIPAFVIERYRVDESQPAPAPAPAGPTVQVALPAGHQIIGWRPGNAR